ncbi:MAG: ROK family protein [Planctomycetia bacterium]|nr:ROK family protein [Planctomycetia bacterium]
MARNILAIDIGGSKILAGWMQIFTTPEGWRDYQILQTVQESLAGNLSERVILETIDRMVERLFPENAFAEVEALGVTIPGLADEEVWIYAPFSGIENFPIVRELRCRYGKPVRIANDVNACALAERQFGKCRDARDYVWMTISNGIGGGIVLNGKIYPGALGFSGEFGHMTVVEDGQLCGCGKRGCLEAECAGPGLARFYATLEGTSEPISAAEIARRAEAGEASAVQAFVREGKLLGLALANIANILNPEKILLGGGVTRAWKWFSPTMQAEFEKNLFRRANSGLKIEQTGLGYEAALIGAAALTEKEENETRC